MKGRPLPGAVERPFGARFTAEEFAEAVLRPQEEVHVGQLGSRQLDRVPLLVRLAIEAAR